MASKSKSAGAVPRKRLARKSRVPSAKESKPNEERTEVERAAMDALQEGLKRDKHPRIALAKEKDRTTFSIDHPNPLVGLAVLARAVGSGDSDFTLGLVDQLLNASRTEGTTSQRAVNFMLSVVENIKPRDHVEAMLAAQMASVHMASMTFARRLANVENIPQQDSAERAFNKLARTFANQMEALKRYRTGGEQKVTVQHVSVSEGGQAIVGNVTQGASNQESSAQAPKAIADAKSKPMPIVEDAIEPTAVRSQRKAKVGRDE